MNMQTGRSISWDDYKHHDYAQHHATSYSQRYRVKLLKWCLCMAVLGITCLRHTCC